jgi:hypothetical protein
MASSSSSQSEIQQNEPEKLESLEPVEATRTRTIPSEGSTSAAHVEAHDRITSEKELTSTSAATAEQTPDEKENGESKDKEKKAKEKLLDIVSQNGAIAVMFIRQVAPRSPIDHLD